MRYAELHAKTNFSFLEGASHPDELVRRAAELGYHALAVTDASSLAGVVRAHGAAKEVGLKLVVGAEIAPEDAPPVVLWATDRAAYGRLARLITAGRRRAEKGQCRLTLEDIAEHAQGLVAGVMDCKLEIADWKLQVEEGAGGTGGEWRVAGGGKRRQERTSDGSSADGPRPGTEYPVPGTPYPVRDAPYPASHPEPKSNSNSQSSICNFQFAIDNLQSSPPPPLLHALRRYRDIFPDRCYLLAELFRGPDDRRRLERLVNISRRSRLPLVAAGGVHYHVPERKALHDVLTAVRHGTTVAEAGEHLFPNAERHLKSIDRIAAAFGAVPEAVRRTVEIADRATFSLDELRYEYPEELAPQGETPLAHLTRLAWKGARKRYPRGVPDKVRRLLEHELGLIGELRYEAYFLTVWDLVRFARRRGILCQGRGSAANSAVCYCLGVTAVDPERMDLLFERFVSRERNEAPDIDVDFEHERREEVIQYLYDKYGRDRAGMTAEVITYRPRSAVRDVGKALGLSLDRVDRLAKRLEHFREEPELPQRCREASIDPDSPTGRQLVELVGQLVGFPRHLSQHTGGMVITRGRLSELVPIENAAMDGRTVIQWNKDDLDELGILKVDCLALGMLTAVRKCFGLIEKHHGRRLSLATVPPEDPDVYAMIRRADTMGVFQIESRAQMSMLPRLRPRCFYDLVIEVAIVRPGPIQGDMVHPYLRRRSGREPVSYPNEAVREVLHKTLGVPLFQEQAMRLAVVAAGFTPGEADQLRRAMGAWRRPGVIDRFRRKLIDGMLASGMSRQYAEATFQQIRGFGDYGFPESHAASFALLVYVSAWLKCHYPAAFTAALLNSQPMGFYAPAQLVRDARSHGVGVLPADVNRSGWESGLEGRDCKLQIANCKLEIEEGDSEIDPEAVPGTEYPVRSTRYPESTGHPPLTTRHSSPTTHHPPMDSSPICNLQFAICNLQFPPLRLGLHMLHGLSEAHGRRIVEARGERPYGSLEDFTRRTGLGRAVAVRLAKAGAFASLGLARRGALWHALGQEKKELPLFDAPGTPETRHSNVGHASSVPADGMVRSTHPTPADLPKMSPAEEVLADYRTMGLSLSAHPMQFLREHLDRRRVARAEELAVLPNGGPVRVAGIVLVRQRPGTAKGITFVTLEDETGQANLIVRPDVWRRWRAAALGATILLAHGRLQREGQVIHVLVTKLENLSELLHELVARSRDFC